MKILMTYPYFTGKGGMETVTARVLNYASRNMEIEFLLSGGSDNTNWIKNVNNESGKVVLHNHRSYPGVFLDTFNYIRKTKPDIVITLNNLQIMPIMAAKKLYVPNMKVYAWHHFALRFLKGNNLLKYCDSFLAIASGMKRDLINMGIDEEKIHLIYDPVDRVKVPTPQSKDGEPKHFVYIGRLEAEGQKNVSEIYRILGALKNKNWVFDVYGAGADEQKLRDLSKELGIEDKVNYFGWQKDVWSAIKVADLVFLSSKYEGFPMSVVESVAHGIPCIVTNCPVGPDDIIKEGVNGHLYEIGDIQDAAKTVDGFLDGSVKFGTQKEIQASDDDFYTDAYMKRLFNILREKQ